MDFITAPPTWAFDFSKSRAMDYITQTKNLLEAGKAKGVGNRYVQLAMIMTMPGFSEGAAIHTIKGIQEGTKFMEENGIKPMFSTESFAFPRA